MLKSLLFAYETAKATSAPVWDFAVELEALERSPVCRSELRRLIREHLVVHRQETTKSNAGERTFRELKNLSMPPGTCFVLAELGVAHAQLYAQTQSTVTCDELSTIGLVHKPSWDPLRRELSLDGRVIKAFRVPAANQEHVLTAFEQQGWPSRIEFPLSRNSQEEPQRRLHDCLVGLNRNHRFPAIRFRGDGTGRGIRWEMVPAGRSKTH